MHRKEYVNSLFIFVEKYKSDSIILKESYALLPLETPNSHIRIDKLFSKDIKFLPFAHFTTTNDATKIHIGFYDDGNIEPFPDSINSVTKDILDNAIAARSQLDYLMKDFSEYVSKLEKKYTLSEGMLCIAETQDERHRLYLDCITSLEERSHLLKEKDPRLELLKSQKKYFTTKAAIPSKQREEKLHKVEAQQEYTAITTEANTAGSASLDTSYNHEQECIELVKKFNKTIKTKLLERNIIIMNIEAIVGLHSVTPCLSHNTLKTAKNAIKHKVSSIDIIIDKIRSNDYTTAYTYALHANPTEVLLALSNNKTLSAKQILLILKPLCARSPIYNFIVAHGVVVYNQENYAPFICYFNARIPYSKDKTNLIDFLAKRIRVNTLLYEGTCIPFLNDLVFSARTGVMPIPDAIRIIGIVLNRPQYTHMTTKGLTYTSCSANKHPITFSSKDQSKQIVYTEFLYSAFPNEEQHLNNTTLNLMIKRANLTELILLLQNIALSNPNINTRLMISCSLKNHCGLAVGNDKASIFKLTDKFRTVNLYSEIKPCPVTILGIEEIIKKINSTLFENADIIKQQRLLNTAYTRITELSKSHNQSVKSPLFFVRAKSLCAQIALSITPSNTNYICDWAEKIQKALLETLLHLDDSKFELLLDQIFLRFFSARQHTISFTQTYLKRLQLLLTCSLKKGPDKFSTKTFFHLYSLYPRLSPSDDETLVLKDIALKHGFTLK